MGAAYSSLGQTKVLYATSLVLRGASQIPVKETKCLSCFGRNFWNALTPIHIISDGYAKVFCWLNVFQSFCCERSNQRESVCDADAQWLS